MNKNRLAVVAHNDPSAQEALEALQVRYDIPEIPSLGCPTQADIVIVLGGDGFMLHTLHQCMGKDRKLYGMNCGTVGFLMNEYSPDDLFERLEKARETCLHPLRIKALDDEGNTHELLAINEASLLRRTGQASKIRIRLDHKIVMDELVADGVLVATPAGSSAYNFSVGGPIMPLRSNLLALTPIAPFRPRRWRGALLPREVHLSFEILKSYKRPVNAVADFNEVKNVVKMEVSEATDINIRMLFDPGHSLEERILREQFTV